MNENLLEFVERGPRVARFMRDNPIQETNTIRILSSFGSLNRVRNAPYEKRDITD